jgi:hypothetical protein
MAWRWRTGRSLRAGVLLPLVLTLLAGLVGMHGLGPVSVFQPRHEMPMAVPAHGDAPTASPGCDHQSGGTHAHADATCAAGGVSGGPVLSLPVGRLVAPAAVPVPTQSFPATSTSRAPPSLAQLQLLRI